LVTNLPAEARSKWLKYTEAKTPEEKLKALQEFLSAVPKHKGTENLVYWAKKRMAELREEIEERRRRRAGRGGPSYFIEKEGAAQIIMVGLTKCGKSSLLSRLTNAKVEIGDVPYLTRFPVPGMLSYEDIQFQVVEAPSLIPNTESSWNTKVLGLVRNADGLIIIADLSNKPLTQLRTVILELMKSGIHIVKPKGRVVIERTKAVQGIRVITYGKLINCTIDDVRKLLESYRIYNAIVRVYGEVTLDDVEKSVFENVLYKPTLILLNKADKVNHTIIKDVLSKVTTALKKVPVIVTSARTGLGLDYIAPTLFKMLEIIRVYTKEPNSKPSPKPLILKKGATVFDVAKVINEDFIKYFKYAKVWGPSVKYQGMRVGLDHELMDKDIVEIHTTIRAL